MKVAHLAIKIDDLDVIPLKFKVPVGGVAEVASRRHRSPWPVAAPPRSGAPSAAPSSPAIPRTSSGTATNSPPASTPTKHASPSPRASASAW